MHSFSFLLSDPPTWRQVTAVVAASLKTLLPYVTCCVMVPKLAPENTGPQEWWWRFGVQVTLECARLNSNKLDSLLQQPSAKVMLKYTMAVYEVEILTLINTEQKQLRGGKRLFDLHFQIHHWGKSRQKLVGRHAHYFMQYCFRAGSLPSQGRKCRRNQGRMLLGISLSG